VGRNGVKDFPESRHSGAATTAGLPTGPAAALREQLLVDPLRERAKPSSPRDVTVRARFVDEESLLAGRPKVSDQGRDLLDIRRLRNLGRKERGDTPLGASPDAVDRIGGQRMSTLGFSDVATGDRPRQAATSPSVALAPALLIEDE
jgi:hypothetical protein